MGALTKVFHKIGDAIKNAFEAVLHTLKAAMDAAVGALKAVYECTIALVKAIQSGNFAKIAESLVKLCIAVATVTQPELLAASVAAQAAMSAVKDVIKMAAGICGLNPNQGWMKKTLGALSQASNFTNFRDAAMAIGAEVTANIAGEKGPLQLEWESQNPDKPEDENYKETHKKYNESKDKQDSAGNDFAGKTHNANSTSLTIG